MATIRSKLRQGAAALALGVAAASAHAIEIRVGSYTPPASGSPADSFRFVGDTFTVAASPTPVDVWLGALSFAAGDCDRCSPKLAFDALVDITIDGVTQQFELPYVWHSAGPQDFLTFSTPSPVVFDFASLGLVKIEIEAPPKLSSTGPEVYGQLAATVTTTPVPEPSVVLLLLSGFGAIGFVARRRS